MIDEQKCINEAKNGSQEAFAQVVEAHQKRVYQLAFRMMGNHEDAQDVVQEAFFKAWSALPNFKGDSQFSTWMHRLTSNTAIDHLRKKKDTLSLTMDYPEQEEGSEMQLVDGGQSPGEVLEQKELRQWIQEGLGQLTDVHRVVLILREVEGLSYQEISTTLDVDLGTVKSRIARGRKTLRDFLKKKIQDTPEDTQEAGHNS